MHGELLRRKGSVLMTVPPSFSDSTFPEDAIVIPVSDCLDLHTFAPRELENLIPEYLQECQRKGFSRVRLIHGKGKGVQRAQVRTLLSGLSIVSAFRDAPPELGHYGATLVWLKDLG